ncbi:DUF3421 domain-containing protein [Pseudooceanicola nitratireducens]|uniref:DUF3421 domain-containing protein n=1 Tax=Pseudooceanicola nitratireducens TaxID=517719 RepID=UPI001C981AEC|nr:DUF3421 domain-containing protein [Pseudooceanicola nitratireducens]MBY6164865.1 DUF3421 domain-containing protein [Pseudooceanicola nitratireducens]
MKLWKTCIFIFTSVFLLAASPDRTTAQALEWSADISVQTEAIQGGWEEGGSPALRVCRGKDPAGNLRPGKLVSGNCNIVSGGKEVAVPAIGILIAPDSAQYSWEGINDAKPPEMKRFYDKTSGGEPLFVCRAKMREYLVLDKGMHPGELSGMECRFGYGGEAQIAHDDEFSDAGVYFNSPYQVLYSPRTPLTDTQISIAEAAISKIDEKWRNQHGFINIYEVNRSSNDNENPTLFTAEYIFLLKQLGLLTGDRRQELKEWAIQAVDKIRVTPGLFVRIPEDRYVDRDIQCTRIFSRDEMTGLIVIDFAFDYELGFAQEIYQRGVESGWLFDNRSWRPDGSIGDVCTHGEWHSASSFKAVFDSYRTPKFQGLVAAATGQSVSLPQLSEVIGGLYITQSRDPESTSGKILGMMRAKIFAQSNLPEINKAYAVFENHMYNQYGYQPMVGMFETYFNARQDHPFHTLVELYDH